MMYGIRAMTGAQTDRYMQFFAAPSDLACRKWLVAVCRSKHRDRGCRFGESHFNHN